MRRCNRILLQSLPQEIPTDLCHQELADSEVLVHILQNTLFCKNYSYSFDLTTAYNFLIVLYLMALLMQAAGHGALNEQMRRELGSLGVHGLLASILLENVPQGFRDVFGTAEFGSWMLAT